MKRTAITRLGAAALVGGSLLVAVAPAHAADEHVLHVSGGAADCADDGPGTAGRPFCTIGAAAARVGAGQTVKIAEGVYPERVTIPASGTAEEPISFVGSTSDGRVEMTGPTAGFVIDGQRHIRIENVTVLGAVDVPGFDLTGAAGIILDNVGVARNDPTAPALRFTGVSESSVTRLRVSGGRPITAVVLDAATTGVTIDSASLWSGRRHEADPDGAGIQVEGTGNTIVNSVIDGIGAGIRVGPAATGTVVANNDVRLGTGHGIHNQGASETAIANNLVAYNCGNGIRVDGASAGVSVQNNVVDTNGVSSTNGCTTLPATAGQIAVHNAAAGQTVVDYNNAYAVGFNLRYGWNGRALGLAEFRTASGQAANDRESRATVDTIDSANSAAPGYPATDLEGVARVDDFGFANTGAGPVPYADRGPREVVRTVSPDVEARLDLGARSVTLDASVPSVAGTITSYEFAFGDGTVVTQESAVATHRYASHGTRSVTVRARNSDGHWSGGKTLTIDVAEPTDSIGLYVPANGAYATAYSSPRPPIYPNSRHLSDQGAQFDLVDGGNGRVAIFSRSAGRYVTAHGSGLSPDGVTYDDPLRLYRLVRNSDGSVSLRSEGNGRYVTVNLHLVASATEIGTREKFYRVNVDEAGRSLKAKANDRFVTADSEGTKPLIANRTAVGGWERFDLIDLGDSQVAFLAHADRQYVTAEKAGAEPLISARYAIGGWEKFLMVRHADGTVSFKALANDRYVTAEDGGAKPLIASRTSVGSWEKFTLG